MSHAAFLADIIEHPTDDTPRLIYADWLEDTCYPAQPARAEFIRVQCELARLTGGAEIVYLDHVTVRSNDQHTSVTGEVAFRSYALHLPAPTVLVGLAPEETVRLVFRMQERECHAPKAVYRWNSHSDNQYTFDLLPTFENGQVRMWSFGEPKLWPLQERAWELLNAEATFWGSDLPIPAHPANGCSAWKRGFVEEVALTSEDWLTHQAAIRAATPLRKVRLTTRPWIGWGSL